MNRSDPYDMYVVIPEGCENWIRLDYLHAAFSKSDMTDIQSRIVSADPSKFQVQMFTRHLKQGVVPYIRFYFKEEADAAIFKLTFAHISIVDKSHWHK